MACERFGVFKSVNRTIVCQNTVARRQRRKPRKTGTKKCNFPFRLRITCVDGKNWKLWVFQGQHNHSPYDTLIGHSFSGRLNPEEKDLCISLSVNGVKPALILSTMKSRHSKNVSTARTIYNVKSKFRIKAMEGRTKMQKLLQLLDVHHYVTSNKRETNSGRVLELFWSHPDGSKLAQCFPTVLLLDCTYKTNRWSMSLFHAVGVTPTSLSFTIAYCFMSAEKTENYIWALQQLRQLYSSSNLPSVIVTDDDQQLQNAVNLIFPEATRLLCTYHISCNVSSHFEKDIASSITEDLEDIKQDWETLWRFADHALYEINLAYFLKAWSMLYPTTVSYLRTQWLARKEQFVYALTNNILHLGNTTTNRAESEHAALKNFLRCSTGDFLKCWQDMDNQWVTRVINIRASLEKQNRCCTRI
ncbi:PKS-NRPS hybrid synthetase CHGG_01239-like [Papaver somniferum]|uniref:PKS-NRPS hybrid synthetase CHGG_01239-like n=1 Tax=Papaver somniferum TaxID=3469 RepID=UPI000E6FB8F1|nr:PKS-NRPS hybrid synthetase CHGG_01239-like [Papaver somniferum]